MEELLLVEQWGMRVFIGLILLGVAGYIAHGLMTYKLTFGRAAGGKRMFLPAIVVGMLSAVIPFALTLREDLINALLAIPSKDFIGFPWWLMLYLVGDTLNKILFVVICVLVGIGSYFLLGFISLLLIKLYKLIKGGS